jgi:hypothetical protein
LQSAGGTTVTSTVNPGSGNAILTVSNTNGSAANNLLNLNNGASTKFSVDVSGNVVVASGGSSTINGTELVNVTSATALKVQDASSNIVLNVDTSAKSVTVGNVTNGGQFINYGSTLDVAKALTNFNYTGTGNSGTFGTAGTTVDIYTSFTVNQTTAGQTLVLQSPTTTTAGRVIRVANIGAQSFTISGTVISIGTNATFFWNGSTWTTTAVSTGVTLVGALNGGTANATGATISGNTIYLQSASASFAGLVDTTTQTFVGNKTLTGQTILGNASNQTQLIVRANASQTSANPLIMLTASNGTTEYAHINADGANNLFFGTGASAGLLTSGTDNISIGINNLGGITTGIANVTIGTAAGQNITKGSSNVLIGLGAGATITGAAGDGNGNIGIGQNAVAGTGSPEISNIIGIGSTAGTVTNATSNFFNNIFLGIGAGSDPTSFGGDDDTFLTLNNISRSGAIGNFAQVQASNTIVLGGIGTDAQQIVIGSTMPTSTNAFGVSPAFLNSATNGSQSTNTLTDASKNFTTAGVKIGMRVIFANGTDGGTVTAVGTTTLTLSTSQTVSAQHYRIHNVGFQVTNGGDAYIQSTSATAFQIQNAGGTSLLTADTSSSLVTITGTVNSTSGYKFNGTAGSTTTCSGGNVLQNAVIQGGIITGGTCVANGGGSSGFAQGGNSFTATGVLGTNDTFDLQIRTNSLTRINITSGGNVTIGGTDTVSSKLYIDGGSAATTWTARSAAGNNDNWRGITYGNGLFVAVGEFGSDRVMTSPDGITWTARSAAGNDDSWEAVTYGNGQFVAVGTSVGTTDDVMTSPDGITWTVRSAVGNNDSWTSVTYGNGLYVAVSNGGDNIMTSPDGITWTSRTAPASNLYSGVTYGNGIFVAVSTNGTNRAMTSPDGITWTGRSVAGNNDNWSAITFGNGLFVAVSYGGDRVMTSPDGITWTTRSAAGNDDSWEAVTFGNGLFVAVGDTSGAGTDYVMTSPDGITWTARTASAAATWLGVAYGNSTFVAISLDATSRAESSPSAAANALEVNGNSYLGDLQTSKITAKDLLVTGTTNLSGVQVTGTSLMSTSVSDGYVATIYNSDTSNTADGLLIKLGVANASRGTGNYFVGFATADGTVAGKIQGGASAVAYTTTGADYAEYFRADPADLPKAGELVTIDTTRPNGVRRAVAGDKITGVISTNPGFVGNGPLCNVSDTNCDSDYAKWNVLVSLNGQVPLKTNDEGGVIHVGDPIGASSVPGVATRATDGTIIGYALTTPDANGMIQVVINAHNADPTQDLQAGSISGSSLDINGDATIGNLNVTNSATIGSLHVLTGAIFDGDVTIAGTLRVGDIVVNGHIVTGGNQPKTNLNDAFNSAGVTATIEGNDTTGTITLTTSATQALFNDPNWPTTLNMDDGVSLLNINFDKQFSGKPRILLSPANANASRLGAFTGGESTDSFQIFVNSMLSAGKTYTFTYWAAQ